MKYYWHILQARIFIRQNEFSEFLLKNITQIKYVESRNINKVLGATKRLKCVKLIKLFSCLHQSVMTTQIRTNNVFYKTHKTKSDVR